MKGDFQVRFCEKLGLKCLCLLDYHAWLFQCFKLQRHFLPVLYWLTTGAEVTSVPTCNQK